MSGDETLLPADLGPPSASLPTEDFEPIELIGRGGMGEVWRVHDPTLDRRVALKTVRTTDGKLDDRFREEARLTARVQHPGVVPIHAIGVLDDGRPYFVMQEVRGQTLARVIRELHAVSGARWTPTTGGWTLERLVGALRQACQTLAYAHEQGIVHRDLKPDNVMVGQHGEVLVVDWGLALEGSAPGMGASGTPAYLPPELVTGGAFGPAGDVYGLGAILYEILAGRPPYVGPTATAVLQMVRSRAPVPVGWRGGGVGDDGVTVDVLPLLDESTLLEDPSLVAPEAGPPLPPDLVDICERAMARAPRDRYPSATALAEALGGWLDGSLRQARAVQLVERAAGYLEEAEALREEAAGLHREAELGKREIPWYASEEDKHGLWSLEDRSEELVRAADLAEVEHERLLAHAVGLAPDLPEPRVALVSWHRQQHLAAEASSDRRAMARAEALLRAQLDALPGLHPVRRDGLRYLSGEGALTVVTDPPGADIELHRYVPHRRRLVTTPLGIVGRTPLVDHPIAMGSYLCVLRHPDHPPARYPVSIGRLQRWDANPPSAGEAFPIPLDVPVGPTERYVPAGWYLAGGDPQAHADASKRMWCDGFVIQRFPVTNAEYLAFLDDLVAHGREEEALWHAPRENSADPDHPGALVVERDADGRFVLGRDADGDAWEPEHPVVMVSWEGARAYGVWWSERTGLPWRLPSEFEWEKAARGVDGRWFPWGDRFDPSWALMRMSRQHGKGPVPIDSYPVDCSPYDVRGLGGNVRDWCLERDVHLPLGRDRVNLPDDPPDPADRIFRGGAWGSVERSCRSAYRFAVRSSMRMGEVGFRLARSV
ncbi:MAG: SUMF1/EgtB/PvdO family nonheme iron enzyme [Alphaproteobacteria bacterium]|nr:SUMF1/EgtB/PvdO family nonheme iron enzyme [Alphaproteobacteria bacterium]